MTDHDPLMERLAALDPVAVDGAPASGSSRHADLWERAMHRPTADADRSEPPPFTPSPGRHGCDDASTTRFRRRRPGRRTMAVIGTAAAVLAITAGGLIFRPDQPLTPAAALTQAVENTAEALTLRSEYVRDDGEGGLTVVRSEHRGGDLRRTFSAIAPDGTEKPAGEGDEFVVYIGDEGWTATDGPTIVPPEQRNAPYAESSAAIVEAAVSDSTVTEVGTDDVRGVDATHYRISLDEGVIRRLSELRPNQLSAFELENPSDVRSLDVWIADGYIRRIRVTQTWEAPDSPGTTVEFYDFGADITISPPG